MRQMLVVRSLATQYSPIRSLTLAFKEKSVQYREAPSQSITVALGTLGFESIRKLFLGQGFSPFTSVPHDTSSLKSVLPLLRNRDTCVAVGANRFKSAPALADCTSVWPHNT